jgi:GT2 family glycosyltransferase
MRRPSYGVIVLSMGNRNRELSEALQSLLVQTDVDLDVVVVGNGWKPVDLPPGVRSVTLLENVGVPEGRNVGARHVSGDLLFFYDDDALLPKSDILASIAAEFAAHPRAGAVQPRVMDATGLPSPRRWVPRVRVGDPLRGGIATGVVEGLFAVRRTAFEQAGGWPGRFFYSHEGIELVWRLYEAGWVVRYAPSIEVNHPATAPTRHAVYYRLNARNRAWVARRNLPFLLVPLYLAAWTSITVARVRSSADLRVWFAGLWEGLTTDCGARRRMRWRTVLRLTRAGRPPLV